LTIAAKKPTLSPEQFKTLSEIIYKRSGIHFPENKKYVLESRLSARLAELEIDDYDHYLVLLDAGPYQKEEFQEMFNRITINETSFFRNEPQLEAFEKQILPELIEARKGVKRLRIWSAACSSGEEPYTLAMLIHRTLGVRLADWNIEILGTDISEKVLETAQSAKYTSYAMRSTSDLLKQRYFSAEGTSWTVKPEIREMVRFELHNLKDRLAAKRHGTWDVIFCRNVMIYFDDKMKGDVLCTFAEVLAKDGRLFIGHSESIRGTKAPFDPLPLAQAFCYAKTPNGKAA
jgi:chemotaxis protein methyltransferase CheR